MFRQVLFTHWKWARLELGVYAVVAFVIPTGFMKAFAMQAGTGTVSIASAMDASVGLGVFLATLAFIAGTTLSVRPWTMDQARQHVFPLSLPVAWPAFVRLRFLAGATLLLVPAVAAWLGGVLASVAIALPDTLHAYPASIAARFLGAALVFYAAVFAVQYLAGRRAPVIVAGALVTLLLVELVGQGMTGSSPMFAVWKAVTTWPGPFEVLTARWMLVDV